MPADKRYGLTDRGRENFREVVRRVVGEGPPRVRDRVTEELSQSPEIYVARVPVGGIPELIGDEPGSAVCDVYQLILDGTGTGTDVTGGLAPAAPSVRVWNISLSAIDEETTPYVLAVRDKYGKWYAGSVTAGGSTPSVTDSGIQDPSVHCVAGVDWPDDNTDVFFRRVERNPSGEMIESSPTVEYGVDGATGIVYEHAKNFTGWRCVDPDDGTVSHQIPMFKDPSSGDYDTDPNSFVGYVEWDEWYSINTVSEMTDVVVSQNPETCVITTTKTFTSYDYIQSFFNTPELLEVVVLSPPPPP